MSHPDNPGLTTANSTTRERDPWGCHEGTAHETKETSTAACVTPGTQRETRLLHLRRQTEQGFGTRPQKRRRASTVGVMGRACLAHGETEAKPREPAYTARPLRIRGVGVASSPPVETGAGEARGGKAHKDRHHPSGFGMRGDDLTPCPHGAPVRAGGGGPFFLRS